jgi:hypothetical protein
MRVTPPLRWHTDIAVCSDRSNLTKVLGFDPNGRVGVIGWPLKVA